MYIECIVVAILMDISRRCLYMASRFIVTTVLKPLFKTMTALLDRAHSLHLVVLTLIVRKIVAMHRIGHPLYLFKDLQLCAWPD